MVVGTVLLFALSCLAMADARAPRGAFFFCGGRLETPFSSEKAVTR